MAAAGVPRFEEITDEQMIITRGIAAGILDPATEKPYRAVGDPETTGDIVSIDKPRGANVVPLNRISTHTTEG
jgi:hypothetical protein